MILKKNKKGFTLTEMLAVVAILAIFAGFLIPNFLGVFSENLEKTMKVQENNIVDAAKLYVQDYCLSPIDINYTCASALTAQYSANNFKYYTGNLSLDTLVDEEYIDPVVANKGTICSGYIKITAQSSNGLMSYKTYLSCGDTYQTEGYGN